MNAPRYIENNKDILWNREYSLNKHYSKLTEIKKKASRFIDNSAPFRIKSDSKRVHVDHYKNEDQLWIDRANKLIQGRLKSIENRKSQWNDLYKSFTPKSNFELSAKINQEKIKQENMILASKILNPSPNLSTRKLEEEYKQLMQYKKQLSKKHILIPNLESSPSRQELPMIFQNSTSLSPKPLHNSSPVDFRQLKLEEILSYRGEDKKKDNLEDIMRHRWKEGIKDKQKKKSVDLSPYEAAFSKKKSRKQDSSLQAESKKSMKSKLPKITYQRSASNELPVNSVSVLEETTGVKKGESVEEVAMT